MASQDWFEKDFYAVLGVPSDADVGAIKKAYRKLVRHNHPDTKPGDTAAEQRFKDIGEAYGVLSDPEQRQQYDAIRQMSRGGARFTAGGATGGAAGGFEDVFSGLFNQGGGTRVRFDTRRGGGAQPDLDDLLGGMFGGQFGGQFGQGGYSGYGAPAGPRRGSDIAARTTVGFRQAAVGDTVTLSGVDGGRITTRIPAGVKDGQKIRLRGKGQPGEQGAPPGDLILTVHVENDPVFGRDGENLTVDLPVTFAEAALGATVAVPTLEGPSVKVRVAPGTPSGRVLRVKGRGIATRSGTGDLLAKVNVVVPQRLSDKAREAVETLRAEDGDTDPRAELYTRTRA